jgi:hypothetical protein
VDKPRTIGWTKRNLGKGKIVIGSGSVEDSRLNKDGDEPVPAGQEVTVYEMDAWFK